MSSPRYWPGFARSERRRRRCGRGEGGGVVDDGGGNGGSGRIIAAFQGREREETLRTGYRDAGGQGRRSACGVPAHADICLHAPCGAGCFLTVRRACLACRWTSLNAPSGAGCFLTKHSYTRHWSASRSLNAPSGAGCFLTSGFEEPSDAILCLNAPSGAGCFLTRDGGLRVTDLHPVLTHLLVLGTF